MSRDDKTMRMSSDEKTMRMSRNKNNQSSKTIRMSHDEGANSEAERLPDPESVEI